MAKTLPELLAIYLERLGLSNNSFAKLAGCVQSTVSKVRNGGSPPEDREEAWADVLKLKGDERAVFTAVYRGTKAHAQQRAQPYINELAQKVEAQRKEIEDLKTTAAFLVRKCVKKGIQIPKELLEKLGIEPDSI